VTAADAGAADIGRSPVTPSTTRIAQAMTRPILAASSLAAVPSSAPRVDGAAAASQGLAAQTDFERIARAPLPHTPDWTNPVASDPGVTSAQAFLWLGEVTDYRTAASATAGAAHGAIGSGRVGGLAVASGPADSGLSLSPGLAVRPDGSTVKNDVEWKYVNVRRYVAHLSESIGKGIESAAFEPNAEASWNNVRAAVSDLLLREWQSGALKGARPEEAFFVNCDRSTMTQDDLDNGRLVVLVGVATVKPAEFIILRFSHKMADR
jgi:Phage tail sheath C-terminal domain